MISYLLIYICSSAASTSCQVWADSTYQGPIASMQCEAERGLIETKFERDLLLGRNEYGSEHVRFECQSVATGE